MNRYLRVCALLFAMLIYSSSGYADCNKGSFCRAAKCNTSELVIKNQTSNSNVQIVSVTYPSVLAGALTESQGCCSANNWPPTFNVSNYILSPNQALSAWGHENNGQVIAEISIAVSNNTATLPITTATLDLKANNNDVSCRWQNSIKNLSSSQYYTIDISSTNGAYSDAVATLTINDAF
jgi:hypothetical protein